MDGAGRPMCGRIVNGMRTTIDRAGRVVVPKAIRERLQLGPGALVGITERERFLELAAAPVAGRPWEKAHYGR